MKACGKIKYASESRALAALNYIRHYSEKGKRRERDAYYCKACRAWHLTSRPET